MGTTVSYLETSSDADGVCTVHLSEELRTATITDIEFRDLIISSDGNGIRSDVIAFININGHQHRLIMQADYAPNRRYNLKVQRPINAFPLPTCDGELCAKVYFRSMLCGKTNPNIQMKCDETPTTVGTCIISYK
jgi:hypothetical protein